MSAGFEKVNPGGLGLLGFALTTIVLSAHNAGLIPTTGLTIGYAVFWGGLAQVFAGWMNFRRGDTFGGTAFSTYGLFWLGLAFTLILGLHVSGPELGLWMILWGIVTLAYAAIAGMVKARVLTIVLILLTVTFFLLGIGGWVAASTIAGGYVGLITGIAALYLGIAIVANATLGRTALPE
ncbi:MAG: acetate uptake transporter [Nitrososphaeria archaeon]